MHLTASTAEIFDRFVGKADSFMQSSRNLGQFISRKPCCFSNQLQRNALTQHFCRNSERNIAAPQTEKVLLFMVNIILAIGNRKLTPAASFRQSFSCFLSIPRAFASFAKSAFFGATALLSSSATTAADIPAFSASSA